MNGRQTDTVTRVDIRIPNHLYSQIQEIALAHFKKCEREFPPRSGGRDESEGIAGR
jgi:hypothetical protein